MFILNIGQRGLQSDDDVLLMPACTNKVTPQLCCRRRVMNSRMHGTGAAIEQ